MAELERYPVAGARHVWERVRDAADRIHIVVPMSCWRFRLRLGINTGELEWDDGEQMRTIPLIGNALYQFAGSGTTLVAALREGCRAIGIEREPDYWPLIEARCDISALLV